MLIQGGQISSGRFSTVSVAGSYWMISATSLRPTTLPGVVARFLPTSKRELSACLSFRSPLPASDVLGQHAHAAHQVLAVRGDGLAEQLRIGEDEVRRRDRVGDLLHVEAGLVLGPLVEPFGVLDEVARPARGHEIGLLQEIEEGVLAPFGILEALVAALGRDGIRDRASVGCRRGGWCWPTPSCSRRTAASALRARAPDRTASIPTASRRS